MNKITYFINFNVLFHCIISYNSASYTICNAQKVARGEHTGSSSKNLTKPIAQNLMNFLPEQPDYLS